jgi:hypothetical protein
MTTNNYLGIEDYHFSMWIKRNVEILGEKPVLTAITQVVQQFMHIENGLSVDILTDGVPYPETIDKINKYHKPEYMRRYQDKLWFKYMERLDLLKQARSNKDISDSNTHDANQDATIAYRNVCFGNQAKSILDNV